MKNLTGHVAAAVLATVFLSGSALAQQTFPAKPIRVIVPYPAGGVVDAFARVVTESIARRWGQPFIIDSRPGAAANIGTQAALLSEPDGYTWLIGGPSLIANPLLFKSATWNPTRDFAGVGIAAYAPLMLVVAEKNPAKTMRDVVAMAKAKPGTVSAGTMLGSSNQFILEALKQEADAQFLMVPYKGAPPIVLDLVNGSVQMSVLPLTVVMAQVQSGRLRALAIASPARSSLFPEVPTFAEAGFATGALVPWYGFVLPRSTRAALVKQINNEINETLKSPEIRERIHKLGGDAGHPMTPAEIDQLIKSDFEKYSGVVKRGNFTVE